MEIELEKNSYTGNLKCHPGKCGFILKATGSHQGLKNKREKGPVESPVFVHRLGSRLPQHNARLWAQGLVPIRVHGVVVPGGAHCRCQSGDLWRVRRKARSFCSVEFTCKKNFSFRVFRDIIKSTQWPLKSLDT